MPQKSKLSAEEKLKIVENCINGKDSIGGSAKRCRVDKETVQCWIRLYKARGAEGLIPSAKNKEYSSETKLCAVEDYLSGTASLQDICTKHDISDRKMLRRWIQCYNSHGDFKEPNSGGAIYMAKGRKTTLNERIEIVSHCIANNKDYGKTIGQYGISYQQVYGWVKKYEKDGADGLADRRGKRKNEASMSEVEKLCAQLKLKEAENLRLQMENELLKKLDALERGQDLD